MPAPSKPLRVIRAGLLLALACSVLGGCANTRPANPVAMPVLPKDGGAFSVAENALDTWNTIGKVLVSMNDVGYEGRAQMLGLYSVRFREQHFLLRTQAVVIRDARDTVHTRVDALDSSGKPLVSAASVELLGRLAARVPVEVGNYRQPVRLPVKPKRHGNARKPR